MALRTVQGRSAPTKVGQQGHCRPQTYRECSVYTPVLVAEPSTSNSLLCFQGCGIKCRAKRSHTIILLFGVIQGSCMPFITTGSELPNCQRRPTLYVNAHVCVFKLDQPLSDRHAKERDSGARRQDSARGAASRQQCPAHVMGCASSAPAPADLDRPPHPLPSPPKAEAEALELPDSGQEGASSSLDAATQPPFESSGQPPFESLQDRGVLGTGTYGCVKLVVDRESRMGYALKCMSKFGDSLWSGAILREKQLLARVADQHPFLCGLVEAYQDDSCVYMLLPLVTGGELHALIRSQPTPLAPSAACFYVGAVALALEHLHSLGIVYRDLKAENVMLDAQGYPIIIDLGFAKELDGNAPHTMTMCGTPAYMAPELARGEPHGFAVDWWALGILLFECLTGRDPFSTSVPADNTEDAIYRRVCRLQYAWPRGNKLHTMTTGKAFVKVRELVKALLALKPSERLGGRPMEYAGRHWQVSNAEAESDGDDEGTSEEWIPCIRSMAADVKEHSAFELLQPGMSASSAFEAMRSKLLVPPLMPLATRPRGRQLRPGERNPLAVSAAEDGEGLKLTPQAHEDYRCFSTTWARPWAAQPDEDVTFDYTPRLISAPHDAPHEPAAAASVEAPTEAALPKLQASLELGTQVVNKVRRMSRAMIETLQNAANLPSLTSSIEAKAADQVADGRAASIETDRASTVSASTLASTNASPMMLRHAPYRDPLEA